MSTITNKIRKKVNISFQPGEYMDEIKEFHERANKITETNIEKKDDWICWKSNNKNNLETHKLENNEHKYIIEKSSNVDFTESINKAKKANSSKNYNNNKDSVLHVTKKQSIGKSKQNVKRISPLRKSALKENIKRNLNENNISSKMVIFLNEPNYKTPIYKQKTIEDMYFNGKTLNIKYAEILYLEPKMKQLYINDMFLNM